MLSHKEMIEMVTGKFSPDIIAFGQALAEKVNELPKGTYKVEIESDVDERIECKMYLESGYQEVELLLKHDGEWVLVNARGFEV